MAGSYLGDTWVDDSQFTIGLDGVTLIKPAAPSAPPSGGTMTPEQQAAYVAKFGAPFVSSQGHVVNYGEGVSGYEGGRYLGHSQYGPTITDEKNGNLIWDGKDWIPVPDASGSLFGDFITPIAIFGSLVAGGMMLEGFSSALAGNAAAESAALAAADSAAGIGAAEAATAGAAASETAAMSAWAGLPAAEGGGLLSSIGTNAAIGAGKSLVTGGDPLEGAIMGGIGGAIGQSGILSDISGGLINAVGADVGGVAANAITKGVTAAATGAIGAAAGGGSFSDILEAGAISGLTSGAGNYVAGTVLPSTNNTIAGGAGGAAAGLTNAVLTGGDIGNAVLTGAGAGAAGGLATDFGAGPGTAGAVGALTGGLIGSSLQPDPVVTQQPAATQTTTPQETGDFGLSFSDIVPQYIHAPRADMQWGTRLSGGA